MDWMQKWIVTTPGKRTPLKHPPLRVPAQTLEEESQDALLGLVLTATFPVFVGVTLLVTFAFQSWGEPLGQVLADAGLTLVGWLIVLAFAVRSCRKQLGQVRNLRLGMQAERFVGQQLERSRRLGYSVFHDLVDEKRKFNIDHVAIGPAGVFVVETKGRSKPLRGKAKDIRITFDGQALAFMEDGDTRCKTDAPLGQVEANARWVRELLTKLLADRGNRVCRFARDRPMPMSPVVVYPGWFIDFDRAKKQGYTTAVTNDRNLLRYIRRCPQRLSKDEVLELSALLGEYLRDERRHLIEV
jgi:hypothetical protein